MKINVKKKTRYNIVLILICLGLIIPLLLSTFSTAFVTIKTPNIPNAYQGLGVRYDSVYWKNHWYDSLTKNLPNPNYSNRVASVAKFNDYVVLNPDGSNELLPNLKMSGNVVVIDPTKQFVPYTWSIPSPSESTATIDVYYEYQMQKFEAEWRVNLWIDGTGNEAKAEDSCRWNNAEIWIELTPQEFAYFDNNEDELFFAPAYIGVKQVTWYSGTDNPNTMLDPTQAAKNDIYPEVVGDTFSLYAARGETMDEINESEMLSYKGQNLDANVFKNRYFVRMNVDRLQADSESYWWGGWDWKYVSCHIVFEVHLFVIGQWRVMLQKGDVPELHPREPSFGEDWFGDLLDGAFEFFSSPIGWLVAIVGAIFAIIVLLIIFTPLSSILLSAVIGKKVAQSNSKG